MSAPYPAVFAGYEERREQLRSWARRHYIEAFRLKPCRMLDVACGEGFWSALFAAEGFAVSGFDAEPLFVEAANEKYPEIDIRLASIEEPPVYERPFELLFIRGLPHFYSDDLEPVAALRGLRHLLSESGLLLVACYTDGSGKMRPGAFSGEHRHNTVASITATVEAAGYAVEQVERVSNYLQIGARL